MDCRAIGRAGGQLIRAARASHSASVVSLVFRRYHGCRARCWPHGGRRPKAGSRRRNRRWPIGTCTWIGKPAARRPWPRFTIRRRPMPPCGERPRCQPCGVTNVWRPRIPSVKVSAASRRQRAARSAAVERETLALIEKARAAVASGKPGVAAIYYRRVAGQATDQQKSEIASELKRLNQGPATGVASARAASPAGQR